MTSSYMLVIIHNLVSDPEIKANDEEFLKCGKFLYSNITENKWLDCILVKYVNHAVISKTKNIQILLGWAAEGISKTDKSS